MKKAILGLTNANTDIIGNITEEKLKELGLRKGEANGRPWFNPYDIMNGVKKIPGGSPANVVAGASYLGLKGKCGLMGTVGDDEIGRMYIEDVEKNGIINYFSVEKGKSSVCYLFVTPDGERTSVYELGVCGNYEIDFEAIEDFYIFHTAAYESVTNLERAWDAMKYAEEHGVKVSFDLSDPAAVRKYRPMFDDILEVVDILFANEHEARELTGLEPKEAVEELKEYCEIAIVKMGAKGSYVKGKELYKIPKYPCNLVNTTGAGDAYAAGFLYGYVKGFSLERCGHKGSEFAARVCEKDGARII